MGALDNVGGPPTPALFKWLLLSWEVPRFAPVVIGCVDRRGNRDCQ